MFRRALPTLLLFAFAPARVDAAPSLVSQAESPAWDRPILADPKEDDANKRSQRTFRDHGVGPTIDTAERPRAAFTLDLDTASFDLARAALLRGEAPAPAEVRVEEFVKVFSKPPETTGPDAPLGVEVDAIASSHRRGYQVVRITAYAAPQPQRPVDVVVAVDVSAAMGTPPDLDEARELVQSLGAALSRDDRLALIELNSPPEVLRPLGPPPSITDLEADVKRLGPAEAPAMSETTLASAFEALGPKDAKRDRVVVVVGPGSLPKSTTDARAAVWRAAADAAKRGISTYAVGIGRAAYDDLLLGGLASAGRGAYLFAHEPSDAARRVAQIMRRPIAARDPVLEVEFDPDAVTRYRLLGFEGRMEPAPSRREQPTSGALRAGDAVTALYEIKLREGTDEAWGQVRLRYNDPGSGKTRVLRESLDSLEPGVAEADAPVRTRVSVLAAAVAEKLRASYWARRITWATLQERFAALPEDTRADPDAARLGALIDDAARLHDEAAAAGKRRGARPFDRMPVVR
ncbi:MAG: von Willebrand factor type A domain-containing protein [Nannocystaceae bacterium]|nr:von Willebrand factor type A domain-containing protein [bacterium]